MEDRSKVTHLEYLPEALGAYERADSARFHMPGHKGRGMGGFWREALMKWDVTELDGTDNLHQPRGAILASQIRMARAYGAEHSFYVVNGSTSAVQAMILALDAGERLLLSRDCHRSAVSGALLRGIDTTFLLPPFDRVKQRFGMVTPETLDKALTASGATAVLLTSPNYYGGCADLAGLSQIAHEHGALLLVDAAHGAHFPFSEALPAGCGGYADLFAHSQHKTMDALTQAASLHLGKCRVSSENVARALALVETTSPSYLLMASLDWSVFMAARRDWTGQVARCDTITKRIDRIEGVFVDTQPAVGAIDRDKTRLVIDVTGRGLDGRLAERHLIEQGVYVEMSDANGMVLITTPSDEADWYERLLGALETLPYGKPRAPLEGASPYERLPKRRASLREAAFAAREAIPLSKAAGRIAAESIGVYPPGVPIATPGEEIETDALRFLQDRASAGDTLFGVREGQVFVLK